jgi:hypothetical protein
MRARAYRVLCGGLGGPWIVGGLALAFVWLRPPRSAAAA